VFNVLDLSTTQDPSILDDLTLREYYSPGYREIIMTVFSDVDSVADTLVINIPAPSVEGGAIDQLFLRFRII